jgi:hypothetical protein
VDELLIYRETISEDWLKGRFLRNHSMKLATLFLLVTCIVLCTRVYSQERVTLSQRKVSLCAVLDEIERQTGYHYFMNVHWEVDTRKVSIEVVKADLKTVLELCFKNQPCTYQIVGKTIVVKEKGGELKSFFLLKIRTQKFSTN